jgi:phosphoacetylglucosamine mutase
MYLPKFLPAWCHRPFAAQACGVMITASHNPEADNGVKLVEPSGEMLLPDWEVHATQLAQAATDDELVTLVTNLASATAADAGSSAAMNGVSTDTASAGASAPGRPKVIIGRDTRPSGEGLAAACKAGVEAVGVQILDVGVVTTPELHFCVQTYKKYHTIEEAAYFTNILGSYRSLTSGTPPAQHPIHVDCANGVGALKLQQMVPQLQQLGLNLVLYNTGDGRLNHMCGADYVQKEQTYPAGEVVQPSHL